VNRPDTVREVADLDLSGATVCVLVTDCRNDPLTAEIQRRKKLRLTVFVVAGVGRVAVRFAVWNRHFQRALVLGLKRYFNR
jgi:hypothetical protein